MNIGKGLADLASGQMTSPADINALQNEIGTLVDTRDLSRDNGLEDHEHFDFLEIDNALFGVPPVCGSAFGYNMFTGTPQGSFAVDAYGPITSTHLPITVQHPYSIVQWLDATTGKFKINQIYKRSDTAFMFTVYTQWNSGTTYSEASLFWYYRSNDALFGNYLIGHSDGSTPMSSFSGYQALGDFSVDPQLLYFIIKLKQHTAANSVLASANFLRQN